MKEYHQSNFGDSFSAGYEATNPRLPDPEPIAEVLARYAGNGPALELGIGTGRVARPLAARGIEVDGIEISPVMIEQLKASIGGLPIRVIHGSLADFEPPRRYSLVYCTMNTFFFLITRDEQIRAFANIARALNDHGVFILDNTIMPAPGNPDAAQAINIFELTAKSVTLQFSLHHANTQTLEFQRVVLDANGVTMHPWVLRYALPDELDEMAGQAGLHLQTRWADWNAEPFTHESRRLISIYTRRDKQDAG